ncbi:MAG: HEAT repeat domain-containing protein, partial [Actinomycetia bacterium]|nr:HEAT repeat domain-containing protein [Actinomycetes bacterium]
GEKSELILLDILKTSKKPEFKWEAVRSLGLICKEVPEEFLIAKNDKNSNVKKMIFLAIDKIGVMNIRSPE